MSKRDKANKATGKRSDRDADSGHASSSVKPPVREERQELLPSDLNEATDISPRIAFLAYN